MQASMQKKDMASLKEQALAAERYCEETGNAPSSFIRSGVSEEVGPKQ